MKENERLKLCGPFLRFIIKDHATFTICFTNAKLFPGVVDLSSSSFDIILLTLFFLLWSSELYNYCLKENIADQNLIAKWKKQGYENLCCLRCIQTRDTNFGTNCICRVPKSKMEEVRIHLLIVKTGGEKINYHASFFIAGENSWMCSLRLSRLLWLMRSFFFIPIYYSDLYYGFF